MNTPLLLRTAIALRANPVEFFAILVVLFIKNWKIFHKADVLDYPFIPKSTAYLRPGQFWSIPLLTGRFACGRVLQLASEIDGRDRRQFLAGLMDWSGEDVPTASQLVNSKILAHGAVHVKTIVECGGQMVGYRPLEDDGLEVPLSLDQSPEWPDCKVCRGFEVLGFATANDRATLSTFSTWGYGVIQIRANMHFGSS